MSNSRTPLLFERVTIPPPKKDITHHGVFLEELTCCCLHTELSLQPLPGLHANSTAPLCLPTNRNSPYGTELTAAAASTRLTNRFLLLFQSRFISDRPGPGPPIKGTAKLLIPAHPIPAASQLGNARAVPADETISSPAEGHANI